MIQQSRVYPIRRLIIPILLLVFFQIQCGTRTTSRRMTLNYIEYNRGRSFPTRADLNVIYGETDLVFFDVRFGDKSFFPDNSILPNAFFRPLSRLRIRDAVKAFTEPYYGIRLFHFFKKNPHWGLGIDFIHFKVFLENRDQLVRASGRFEGQPLDEKVRIGDYIDYYSVSHGVNHIGLSLQYRLMFNRTGKVPDGRWQPYVGIHAGPTVPHLELITIKDGIPTERSYSYKVGYPNIGLGAGLGLRFKPWPRLGFYFEYKFTYSLLQAMDFDPPYQGMLKTSFTDHHLQWGLSFIF